MTLHTTLISEYPKVSLINWHKGRNQVIVFTSFFSMSFIKDGIWTFAYNMMEYLPITIDEMRRQLEYYAVKLYFSIVLFISPIPVRIYFCKRQENY